MADTSRFPSLVVPFAITGAAGGWLSAGIGGHVVSQPLAALCATILAALAGALLRRFCVGRRYQYELADPDPELRPSTDTWVVHAGVVLGAGAATGGLLGVLDPYCCTRVECWLGGALCAIVFVPVCLAVIAAARRAQRARLGSLVASCDRRAVWGILAMTLAVTTLEAIPEWPPAMAGLDVAPAVALALLAAAGAATLGIRYADTRALRRARDEIDAGLLAQGPTDAARDDREAARLDLGLGDDLHARVARGAAAYRQRERTVALVRGSPQAALLALRRAVRRGTLGLIVIGAAGALHAVAAMTPALVIYDLRCASGERRACTLADALRVDP